MEMKMHWVGMDVAKNTFDAALVCNGQHYPQTPLREVPVKTFTRSLGGVREFLTWLEQQCQRRATSVEDVRVVMEATGKYSLELAMWLLEQQRCLQPAIANPQRTAHFIKSMGVRNKTDRLEARALAFYGMERRPAAYESLSESQRELRELNRYRDFLLSERVAATNRADDQSSSAVVRKIARRRVKQLERDLARVDKEMRELVAKSPSLKRDHDLLVSIPGVGFLSACTLLAEIGDLRRFQRARQLSAFAGVCPRHYLSGASVHGKARMSKAGNARVRKALYMSALTAARMPGTLKEKYDHLILNGKKRIVALGAVMRHLIVLMRAIVISGNCYDAHYRHSGKTCGKQAA